MAVPALSAWAQIFLASDKASGMTGTTVNLTWEAWTTNSLQTYLERRACHSRRCYFVLVIESGSGRWTKREVDEAGGGRC